MVGNTMGAGNEDEHNKSQVESYRRLNTFLQKFFMHGLPSLKMQFNSKGLIEKFLDIEFSTQPQPVVSDLYRGIFIWLVFIIVCFKIKEAKRSEMRSSMETSRIWWFLKYSRL
jgi:hypothetical protein